MTREEVAAQLQRDAGAVSLRSVDVLMSRLRKQLQLLQDLRAALEHSQFSLYYQPKFEIGSDRIVGVPRVGKVHGAGVGQLEQRFPEIAP